MITARHSRAYGGWTFAHCGVIWTIPAGSPREFGLHEGDVFVPRGTLDCGVNPDASADFTFPESAVSFHRRGPVTEPCQLCGEPAGPHATRHYDSFVHIPCVSELERRHRGSLCERCGGPLRGEILFHGACADSDFAGFPGAG